MLPARSGHFALRLSALSLSALVLVTAVTLTGQETSSTSSRAAEMRAHFADALLAVDAIERGDLAGATQTAASIASMNAPAAIPDSAAPYLEALRAKAREASNATSLDRAATGIAVMLTACGDCHRAAIVRPGPQIPTRPDVGGLVGHMLDHQRAIDELTQALVMSSDAHWSEGLDRLTVAPLSDGQLSSEVKVSKAMRTAEDRVHATAVLAKKSMSVEARVSSYASILTACAECHSTHSPLWGPSGTR